jgi:mRNA interferase MazF
VVRNWVPERGQAIWIDMAPQTGHEQRGRRPALVLSPSAYNSKVGLVVLCPITTQVKGYPFEVLIPENIKVAGAILSDQVKSLDWRARKSTLICVIPDPVVEQALSKLNILLQFQGDVSA